MGIFPTFFRGKFWCVRGIPGGQQTLDQKQKMCLSFISHFQLRGHLVNFFSICHTLKYQNCHPFVLYIQQSQSQDPRRVRVLIRSTPTPVRPFVRKTGRIWKEQRRYCCWCPLLSFFSAQWSHPPFPPKKSWHMGRLKRGERCVRIRIPQIKNIDTQWKFQSSDISHRKIFSFR